MECPKEVSSLPRIQHYQTHKMHFTLESDVLVHNYLLVYLMSWAGKAHDAHGQELENQQR